MKKQRKIKLATIMDVKEFVKAAGECDFDVNIVFKHITVDAKSVLGVLSLDLTKELTIEYNGDDAYFEAMLNSKDTARVGAVA